MAKKKSTIESVSTSVEPRTFTDIVKLCENELGWCSSWDDPRPNWKIRQTEVSKMKSVIKKLEREKRALKGKFTVPNLALAIEYLKRKKEYIKSPVAILYYVERALEDVAEPDQIGDVDAAVAEALAEVMADPELNDMERAWWRRRLSRALGPGRIEVVAEWRSRER